MLPKSFRLPLRPTERFKGIRTQTPHFFLVSSPNTLSHSRAAVIIPKKIITRAVARNHLRRQITEIIRPFLVTPPFRDLLIFPRAQTTPLSPANQKQALMDLLHA